MRRRGMFAWWLLLILLVLVSLSKAQNNSTENENVTSSSSVPSTVPSASLVPSFAPSSSITPSIDASLSPSLSATASPVPSVAPSKAPFPFDDIIPSSHPTQTPSGSFRPSDVPTGTDPPSPPPSFSEAPSVTPSTSREPSTSNQPSGSSAPSLFPTSHPSLIPSDMPSVSNHPTGSSPPSTTPSVSPTRLNFTYEGTCGGYIESKLVYQPLVGPHPIFCDNQTFSRWGPPEQQDNACCTDEGRYTVQLAQVGGFDITYKGNPPQVSGVGVGYRCLAYTEALRATVCDARQGQNTVTTPTDESYFRICKSSCEAVYEECGVPGENYPEFAEYTDGTSLCYAAWGGWGNKSCQEQQNKNNFPCTLTGLEVWDDTMATTGAITTTSPQPTSCQEIIYPTEDTLKVYKDTRQPPDACTPPEPSPIGIFIVVIVVVLVSLTVCGTLIYLHARHRQAEEDFS